MPSTTLSLADAEITAVLDVDTSIPLAAMFDGSSDPAPEGIAARATGWTSHQPLYVEAFEWSWLLR